jgi:hypothetical protein
METPFDLWDFDGPVTVASRIACPECHAVNVLQTWQETDVGCEDCGSHAALECPDCGERFDHVYGPTFHVVHDGATSSAGAEA